MKTLRVLLVTVFMLTALASPVLAKEKGAVMGYVPLLTQVNPDIPLHVQARQAFDVLAPKLFEAKKNGNILNFQPELSAGIVIIKYKAGMDLSPILNGMAVFDDIHEAAASIPRGKSIGPQAYNPNFWFYLYNSCFDLYDLGAGNHVVGSLRDKTNRVIAVFTGDADANGDFWDCFYTGAYSSVLPGYKVTIKVYNPGGSLLGTYISIASTINFTAIDKANAILSGTGTANKAYTADWYHPNLDAGNTYLYINKTGTTSAAGNWSVDFGTTAFRGNDDFWVDMKTARFTFERWFTAPYIYCELGSNYCGIYGFPLKPAALTITHAGVPHAFTGKFNRYGYFYVSLEDASGFPIFLAAGDTASGTGIPAFALPNLTAAINYTTDVVSGKAPANKYFTVWVTDLSGWWYGVWSHTNATGNYSSDFTWALDLKATEPYIAEVYYLDSVTGNSTYIDQSFGP